MFARTPPEWMASAPPSYEDRAKALYVHSSHKGGMDNIDFDKISKIILEAAANSPYTSHQLKLDAAVERRVARLKAAQSKLDEAQRQAAQVAVSRRTQELEATRKVSRVVVVVDFDMFYAAVAIREDPSLADKPLAVGGALVLTANYIARRWGVRSGMPSFVAKELFRRAPEFGMPRAELTFVPADYEAYAQVATEAMAIYREYDPDTTQGMGFDEATLDITRYLRRRVRLGSHDHAKFGAGSGYPEGATPRGGGSGYPEGATPESGAGGRLGVVGDFAAASGSDPAGSGGEDEGYSSRDDWQPSDEDEYEDACCGEARPRPRRRPRRRNEVEELLSMHALAEQVVSEIRARVARVTGGLTVSAGIAPNAKLAKMGADVNKPNGQTRIGNSVDAILSFLRDQPLRKVPFVGRVMIAC